MHAISLSQPFASLMAIGAKRWETRGFRISKRHGHIAICATAKMPKEYAEKLKNRFFEKAIRDAGLDIENLPMGCVVGLGLPEVTVSTAQWIRQHCRRTPMKFRDEQEYLFGDYSAGRFASFFPNVQRIEPPIPCKGMQGIWPVSEELEQLIRQRMEAK